MRKRWMVRLVLLLALVAFGATARAGSLNDIARFWGWGWSEGYHARDACRPGPCAPYTFDSAGPPSYPAGPGMEIVPPGSPADTRVTPMYPSRFARPRPEQLRR